MMRKVLKANIKMKYGVFFFSLCLFFTDLWRTARQGWSGLKSNRGEIKMSSVVPEMSVWVARRKECVGLMLLLLPLLPSDEGCRHPLS